MPIRDKEGFSDSDSQPLARPQREYKQAADEHSGHGCKDEASPVGILACKVDNRRNEQRGAERAGQ
jgi:hypothetical protein